MVTHSNNSHLNRTWLSGAHICLVPAISFFLSVCLSLSPSLTPLFSVLGPFVLYLTLCSRILLACRTLWRTSRSCRAAMVPLPQNEMKRSLYQLGTSTESGVEGRETQIFIEDRREREHRESEAGGWRERKRSAWMTSHEPGQRSHLTMHMHTYGHTCVHVNVNAAAHTVASASCCADWHWSLSLPIWRESPRHNVIDGVIEAEGSKHAYLSLAALTLHSSNTDGTNYTNQYSGTRNITFFLLNNFFYLF